jgi:hypothetical protein
MAVFATCLAGCGGSDGPTKPPAVAKPDITSFTGLPSDIAPGDSVLFSYVVTGADSLKLYPTGQKLTVTTTGSVYVKPDAVTLYTLRAYNKSGQDSASAIVSMSSVVPSITQLVADEDTIVVNDSTQVTWVAVRADSVKLNDGARIMPGTGGTIWYHPSTNGNLTLIAYNEYGSDTAISFVRIEVPFRIHTVEDRIHYFGQMGSDLQSPEMHFEVENLQAASLYKVWMKFSLIEGDGTLLADSLQAGAGGYALLKYDFDGALGYARIRAMVPGIDTSEVLVRANVIAPGVNFQGQYVKNGDNFAAVKALNGQPLADTPDPTYWLNYVDYESQLGVVIIIADLDTSSTSQDSEPVYGVILNTIYTGTAASGWGIGSSILDLLAEYGTVTPVLDPSPPAAYSYVWPAYGLTAYTTTEATESDRTVFEVHLVEAQPPTATLPKLMRQR